jgi:hypothetical protein
VDEGLLSDATSWPQNGAMDKRAMHGAAMDDEKVPQASASCSNNMFMPSSRALPLKLTTIVSLPHDSLWLTEEDHTPNGRK